MMPPILITGAARSGTSMVAAIVHLCGAFGGKMSGPTRYNQKGMYENSDVRNYLVKKWLAAEGYDTMGQNPLPDIERCHQLAKGMARSWRMNVERIMQTHGYVGGPWFYKGAKMCLMWPIWAAAFPRARWLIVRRNDQDVIQSCLRTGFMRAYQDAAGWLQWVQCHRQRFSEMSDAGLHIREIWTDNIVRGELSEIREAIDWTGLKWNEQGVSDFVAPGLWAQGKYQAQETR